jgi:predicted ATPase/DNA-binding winged helix-turn-helix (wHTH) protein
MFSFGRCEISPARRELKREGQVITLSDRGFDLLLALTTTHGRIISKSDLMALVWPGRIVEENTLEAQVSLLRRALGSDREAIRTVARRGYQFVAETQVAAEEPAPRVVSLPASRSRLIGRDRALEQLVDMAGNCRLITLVGAGGIGKTRLAIELARRLADCFADRVCIAELGSVSQADFVPMTVASALGFAPPDGNPSSGHIAAALDSKHALLVLDNCEHLIDACAAIVDAMLRAAPFLKVIATSREPLRIEGEQIYTVASLDVPDDGSDDSATVMSYSAIRLFEARLSHGQIPSATDAQSVALKARICRRLDGIPLAIELAAARVAVFGLAGVAERLDGLFDVLTGGSRTALPRQQTLTATFEWSYELLAAEERAVLARLSMFAGQFSLDAACAVAGTAELPPATVLDCIVNLVSKSLISPDIAGPKAKYRLLDMTRVFARQKLAESGKLEHFAKRHSEYFCRQLQAVEANWETVLTADSIIWFEAHVEDLRAALLWNFSQNGDVALGIELTAAAIPYWVQRSHFAECLGSVTRALRHVDTIDCNTRSVMKLYAARGKALLYEGSLPEMESAFNRALDIADQIGDVEYQLIAIWGLWGFHTLNGPYPTALHLAQRFSDITALMPDRALRSVADRMLGMSFMCVGQLDQAQMQLEKMITQYSPLDARSNLVRFGYDQKVAALCVLPYVLWLRGFPDQATRMAEQATEYASSTGHSGSMWLSLTVCACPIALLTGGIPALEHPTNAILERARHLGMSSKNNRQFWRGLFLLQRGDQDAYETIVAPALQELGSVQHATYLTGFWSALCEQLARYGRLTDALSLITVAIDKTRQIDKCLGSAELLRVQGELILVEAGSDAHARAEKKFMAALDAARSIRAMSWQLRAATSLARLWLLQGKTSDARNLLASIYEGFSEGFDTVDLIAARHLLASLSSHADHRQ